LRHLIADFQLQTAKDALSVMMPEQQGFRRLAIVPFVRYKSEDDHAFRISDFIEKSDTVGEFYQHVQGLF
jgi:hypothetical protein